MKFRIVKRQNEYIVQYKSLFRWVTIENIAEMPISFSTVEEAENWIRTNSSKDIIIKEITVD